MNWSSLTYQRQLVPNQQRRREERVFLLQSRWKMCWRNHLLHRLSCHWAFDHQAEFHAPSSTTPNKRYQSALRLGQRGQKYTRAEMEGNKFRYFATRMFPNCGYKSKIGFWNCNVIIKQTNSLSLQLEGNFCWSQLNFLDGKVQILLSNIKICGTPELRRRTLLTMLMQNYSKMNCRKISLFNISGERVLYRNATASTKDSATVEINATSSLGAFIRALFVATTCCGLVTQWIMHKFA